MSGGVWVADVRCWSGGAGFSMYVRKPSGAPFAFASREDALRFVESLHPGATTVGTPEWERKRPTVREISGKDYTLLFDEPPTIEIPETIP